MHAWAAGHGVRAEAGAKGFLKAEMLYGRTGRASHTGLSPLFKRLIKGNSNQI